MSRGNASSVVRRLLAAAVVAWSMSGPAYAISFSVTSKVGAARNSDGEYWVCVIKSNRLLHCGHGEGDAFRWCQTPHSLTQDHEFAWTAGDQGGVYLVPDFQKDPQSPFDMVAFATVREILPTATTYKIAVFELLPGCNCVEWHEYHQAPYMTGGPSPHLAPRLAVAKGLNNTVYVATTVAESDPSFDARGRVVVGRFDNNGLGQLVWQYAPGMLGVTDRSFEPGSPIAGVQSNLTADPLFVLRDTTTRTWKTLAIVYLDGAVWRYSAGKSLRLDIDVSSAIALTNIPPKVAGQDRYGDAILAVGSDKELYEAGFVCTENMGACVPFSHGFHEVVRRWGNDGSPLGLAGLSDSLSASWYELGPDLRVQSYTRISTTSGKAPWTDHLTNWQSWDAGEYVDGATNWTSADRYYGEQTTVRVGATDTDHVYGACTSDGWATRVCRMTRTHGNPNYSWEHY